MVGPVELGRARRVTNVNDVRKLTGTKCEITSPVVTATVSWPALVTSGAIIVPGSCSVSGAPMASDLAVAVSNVWNGAVNGETARTTNTSAHNLCNILTFGYLSRKRSQLPHVEEVEGDTASDYS